MKKSIAKNYIYNMLYQILITVIPLILTPYVSRVLGAEQIGIYGYVLSISALFILVGTQGMNLYGQREIAYYQNKKDQITNTLFELMILKLIFMTISFVTFYIIFIYQHNEYNIYYKILIFEIIGNMIDITWFYQGLEDFKKIFLRNLFVKLSYTLLIFLLVKNKNDLDTYLLIYSLSILLGNITLYFSLSKNLTSLSLKKIKPFRHIKKIIYLFIPQIAIQISSVIDKTMLGIFSTSMEELGIYEQSYKIILLSLNLITSLGLVMIPRISNLYANKDYKKIGEHLEKSFHFVWFIGIPISFGLIGISNNFIPWFLGSEFLNSIIVCMIGALFILISGFTNVTGMQYLIPTGQQNKFTLSIIIGLIINVIGNYLFIPVFGAVGAIIFTIVSELVIFSVQIMFLKKIISMKMIFKFYRKSFFSGLIMLCIIFPISIWLKPNIINTLIIIVIGAFVYITINYIFKEQFLIEMIEKMKIFISKFKRSKTNI